MSAAIPARVTPGLRPLASPEVYRINVEEFERMTLDDPRVELVDGYLVRKMGTSPPHFWSVDATEEHVRALIPAGWCVRREGPVRIPDYDEPMPDLAVARGTRDTYRGRHPGPEDLALLIEVALSSLDRDRGEKGTAYARGGIVVYWIVNLVDRQVEVYTDPAPDGYHTRRDFAAGQDVPIVIDGIEVGRVAVDLLIP